MDPLAELLLDCARGDEGAFKRLYRQSSPTLFSLVLRLVKRRDWAEEILQEAFVTIWRQAGHYDSNKGMPMTWMASIVRRRAVDWLRRRRAELSLEGAEKPEAWVDTTPGPLEETLQSSEARALLDCLKQLEANARMALLLAYYEGYTHEELSRYIETPLGTVKSWIRRALPQLRRCLEP